MILQRRIDYAEIQKRLATYQVTALLGPRQSGKTTLAGQFRADHYFDLENPRDLAQFQNPQLTLEHCRGLIVIDEVQRKPELFPLLRFLVDSIPEQRYLILGSASRDLIRQSSESLAGRVSYYTLPGFRLTDIQPQETERLWLRGGLPVSFLAGDDAGSYQWREDYIRTFLERDIPALGIRIPAETLRRFWQWEGFALDCVWRSVGKADEQAYFWATHSGAEVDLFWQHDGCQWACEFKFADAPTLTKSMCSALDTLALEKLWVIYPGQTRYRLHEKVEVVPLKEIPAYWEY